MDTIYILRNGEFEIRDGRYTETLTDLPEVDNHQIADTVSKWCDRPLIARLTLSEIKQLWQLFYIRHNGGHLEDDELVFEDLHVELAWVFLKDCMYT